MMHNTYVYVPPVRALANDLSIEGAIQADWSSQFILP